MKKFRKTVLAVTNLIITFAGIHCFYQYTEDVKDSDVSGWSATEDIKEPALVPLEIIPPRDFLHAEPFNRSMRPVPNLEQNNGYDKANEPFLVPAGTINVALGKPVSSSDDNPVIGTIERVNDGKKDAPTHDGFVELDPGLQHITIDLLQICEIYAIVVWHSFFIGPVYFDVVVQVSNDLNFSKDVRTLFNNDSDNSSKLGIGQDENYRERRQGKLINANGVQARYVRLYSNGNSGNEMNHYIKIEVHGKPA
ncbi:hypothetical protein ACFL5Z_13065 [Planctomycetota bacterium]